MSEKYFTFFRGCLSPTQNELQHELSTCLTCFVPAGVTWVYCDDVPWAGADGVAAEATGVLVFVAY